MINQTTQPTDMLTDNEILDIWPAIYHEQELSIAKKHIKFARAIESLVSQAYEAQIAKLTCTIATLENIDCDKDKRIAELTSELENEKVRADNYVNACNQWHMMNTEGKIYALHQVELLKPNKALQSPTNSEAQYPGQYVIKENIIGHMINRLRDVAIRFHDTQQLRSRIQDIVLPMLRVDQPAQQPSSGVSSKVAARCNEILRESGAKVMPRSCMECGLGPCKLKPHQPIAAPSPVSEIPASQQHEAHPLGCLHINQGSADVAADLYEAEYMAAKFDKLSGRGMHELRHDELSDYLCHVALQRGVTSVEFKEASDWVVSELVRKTNDEGIISNTLSKLKENSELNINTHAVTKAFWDSWEENGETHKHGYYESTWKALRAAIAASKQEGAE